MILFGSFGRISLLVFILAGRITSVLIYALQVLLLIEIVNPGKKRLLHLITTQTVHFELRGENLL